jgi:hypothetical protein
LLHRRRGRRLHLARRCPQDGDRQNGSISMVFNFDTVWNNGNYGSIGKSDEDIKTDVLSLKEQLHALV